MLVAHLWDHVLEGLHDLVGLELLVVREDASDDHHGGEHDAQVELHTHVQRS